MVLAVFPFPRQLDGGFLRDPQRCANAVLFDDAVIYLHAIGKRLGRRPPNFPHMHDELHLLAYLRMPGILLGIELQNTESLLAIHLIAHRALPTGIAWKALDVRHGEIGLGGPALPRVG